MAIYDSPDVEKTITTESTIILQDSFRDTTARSIFVINEGNQDLSYTLEGSPSGLKTGDKDELWNTYSASEIAKHWTSVSTGTVSSNSSNAIDFTTSHFMHYRLKGNTASGSTTIKAFSQKYFNSRG